MTDMRSILLVLLLLVFGSVNAFSQPPSTRVVKANGAEFHYTEKGEGPTVVFLHGGIGDYRAWNGQFDDFAKSYRVISYSRRFHYPNRNQAPSKPYSVFTEAEDLRAFLNALDVKNAHFVGTSIGAFVALVLAIRHPEMVRSLVLGEPPVHQLIRSEPSGEKVYQDFVDSLRPVREAFERGDERAAMRLFGHSLGRDFDRLPASVIEQQMQNAPGVRANILAHDPFPVIPDSSLAKVKVPVLLITGENTVLIHRLVDQKLSRLLPNVRRSLIAGAGHTPYREKTTEYNTAVLAFLRDASRKSAKNK